MKDIIQMIIEDKYNHKIIHYININNIYAFAGIYVINAKKSNMKSVKFNFENEENKKNENHNNKKQRNK